MAQINGHSVLIPIDGDTWHPLSGHQAPESDSTALDRRACQSKTGWGIQNIVGDTSREWTVLQVWIVGAISDGMDRYCCQGARIPKRSRSGAGSGLAMVTHPRIDARRKTLAVWKRRSLGRGAICNSGHWSVGWCNRSRDIDRSASRPIGSLAACVNRRKWSGGSIAPGSTPLQPGCGTMVWRCSECARGVWIALSINNERTPAAVAARGLPILTLH